MEHRLYLLERALAFTEQCQVLLPDSESTKRTRLQYNVLLQIFKQKDRKNVKDDVSVFREKKRTQGECF